MTDDLGALRQALTDLAEHGGSADLHGRVLRRSKRLQRRAAVTTAAAAIAVLAVVGGGVGLTRANRPAPPAPVATQPPPSVTAPSPSWSARPSSATPSSPPYSPPSSPPSPAAPGCPSARTLERQADLPDGWSFPASSVKCWRTWAWTAPEGPGVGDGIYLFQFRSGSWRYHSQGSGYECADLGIRGNAPFCD